MTMELPEKAKPLLPAVKLTSVGTAVVIGIVLQVMVFNMIGDVLTSAILFGIGYAFGRMK